MTFFAALRGALLAPFRADFALVALDALPADFAADLPDERFDAEPLPLAVLAALAGILAAALGAALATGFLAAADFLADLALSAAAILASRWAISAVTYSMVIIPSTVISLRRSE